MDDKMQTWSRIAIANLQDLLQDNQVFDPFHRDLESFALIDRIRKATREMLRLYRHPSEYDGELDRRLRTIVSEQKQQLRAHWQTQWRYSGPWDSFDGTPAAVEAERLRPLLEAEARRKAWFARKKYRKPW